MKKKQMNEAIKRLNYLNLHPNVLKEFQEGVINISNNGALFWANDEEKEMISEFEKEYEVLVYHAIKTNTTIGTLYSLMYVSKTEEEWDIDRDDLPNYCFVYVKNIDVDYCSEFGTIQIKKQFGGLVRVA